ncbi:hypothetical protein OAE36_00045 [bacterium]|nr:hypothetical protein [bacterium]
MNATSFIFHADPLHPACQSLIKQTCHRLSFYYRNQIVEYINSSKPPIKYNPSVSRIGHEETFDKILAKQLLAKYYTCLNRWNKSFLSDSTYGALVESIGSLYLFVTSQRCKAAIFLTASPHHLSSIILDIACCMAKVDRVFLYPVVFSRRVLPVVKTGTYQNSSYKYYNDFLTNHESFHDLVIFKERSKKRLSPKTNQSIKSSPQDFISSFFKLSIRYKKQKLLNLIPLSLLRIINKNIPSKINEIVPQRILNNHYKISIISRILAVANQAIYNRKLHKTIKKNTTGANISINSKVTLCIFPGIEPEATTAPEGGTYDSIASLAIELRKKFPNIAILYKEHPNVQSLILENELSMAGYYRNRKFLRLISELKIYPVSNEYLDLISKETSVLAVTLTGTIAIERSLSGLQTIVAGIPYYGLGLPGVIPLSSIENIDLLSSQDNKNISDNALNYLSSLLKSKCIDNPFGIGSGIINTPSKSFIKEYLNLLNSTASEQ